MKKFSAIILAIALTLSFTACQKAAPSEDNAEETTEIVTTTQAPEKELSPTEKLESYIMENGEQKEENYLLDCPGVLDKIVQSDFTLANMTNLKASAVTEFRLISGADGITLELLDSSITDNGLKMTRSVTLRPDGTFNYQNNLIMNGVDMGGYFEGEILPETYTKEIIPVITKTKFASGAQLNDASKELMKDYIDLTLDCFSLALSQSELGITLADVGYSKYIAD